MEDIKLPGVSILEKYGYQIITYEGTIVFVEVDRPMSLFDRQKLYFYGWKQNLEIPNNYYYDFIIG